jgi:hypothetical protein
VITGNGSSNKLKGLNGSDLLHGFSDRLAGSSLNVNANRYQRDVLTGGGGADYFELGNIVGS